MTTNKGDIHHEPLEKWPELSDIDKPLMIVFPDNVTLDKVRNSLETLPGCARVYGHPLSGHEQCIYKGKFLSLKEHPEMWDLFGKADPESYREGETAFFLYYRYFLQFEAVSLDYCRSLSKRHNLPSIFIVNDYEYEELDEMQKHSLRQEFEIVNLFDQISEERLSSQPADKSCNIPASSGIFRCWFPLKTTNKLVKDVLDNTDTITRSRGNSSIRKQINGEHYMCLYLGSSKNLQQDVGWKAIQLHNASDAETDALATLKKCIAELPVQKGCSPEQAANDVFNQCFWDWCVTPSYEYANKIKDTLNNAGDFLGTQEEKTK